VILLASLALLGVLVLGAAGVAWLVFAPVAPSGPESDPLVPLRAMQEELGELDGDLSSLEERAEVVMGAMDQALGPLVSSGDLDLALGALTTVGDAHGFMGHRWLEVQCHDAPSCPQLEAERLDRARDHFDTVLHNAGRMERLLEQNGVHDERVGMPEGMRHEAERALGELDERSRGEQPEGPESLLHELGEQLPWWDEWHGRLDACGHDGARALADQVRPVIEDAHRALEHGDPGAADAVLARAGELAPRVERMLSRCP
jgi:hypothetical protein